MCTKWWMSSGKGASRAGDLRTFLRLLRRYTSPYWWAVALLLLTSYLATALAALFPFLIAPILDLALGTPGGQANAAPAAGLSLRNLGAVVIGWLGIASAEDRFRSILILCAV